MLNVDVHDGDDGEGGVTGSHETSKTAIFVSCNKIEMGFM